MVVEEEENFSFEGFEPPILDTEPSSLRAQEILSSPFTFSFLEDWDYSPNMSVCTSNLTLLIQMLNSLLSHVQ